MSARCDLLVIGATPAGIAAAVRAARGGLRVTLTCELAHVGGMLSAGLGVLDSLYGGLRAPVLDEFTARVVAHYEQRYGADSPQSRAARPDDATHKRLNFEPRVAEQVFNEMLQAESRVTLLLRHVAVAVRCDGRVLIAATLRDRVTGAEQEWTAHSFIDASYEGDLMALAGCSYRVGREARDEHSEPHAGAHRCHAVTVTDPQARFPREAAEGKLRLRTYAIAWEDVRPESTGEGDTAIQAFNHRLTLCRDPSNRVPITGPPPGYDPGAFAPIRERWPGGQVGCVMPLPNQKGSWNAPLLIGGGHRYPEADWVERDTITAAHRDYALGLLWFLQNDPQFSAAQHAAAREWGLPVNEFTDNNHVPWMTYVRETRRLVGRYIFTEHDGVAAPGLLRPPLHEDAIAFAEWPLDSHDCWPGDGTSGNEAEGKFFLTASTRPSTIPWRCVLPQEFDNLLVPGCVSATHVGWGTMRLEPTWMHLGESCGAAVALASEQNIAPAQLDIGTLQARLCLHGISLGMANDLSPAPDDPRWRAAQYLLPRGFFPNWDARLDDPLTMTVAEAWSGAVVTLRARRHDATVFALTVRGAEKFETGLCDRASFHALLSDEHPAPSRSSTSFTRGEAAVMVVMSLRSDWLQETML